MSTRLGCRRAPSWRCSRAIGAAYIDDIRDAILIGAGDHERVGRLNDILGANIGVLAALMVSWLHLYGTRWWQGAERLGVVFPSLGLFGGMMLVNLQNHDLAVPVIGLSILYVYEAMARRRRKWTSASEWPPHYGPILPVLGFVTILFGVPLQDAASIGIHVFASASGGTAMGVSGPAAAVLTAGQDDGRGCRGARTSVPAGRGSRVAA